MNDMFFTQYIGKRNANPFIWVQGDYNIFRCTIDSKGDDIENIQVIVGNTSATVGTALFCVGRQVIFESSNGSFMFRNLLHNETSFPSSLIQHQPIDLFIIVNVVNASDVSVYVEYSSKPTRASCTESNIVQIPVIAHMGTDETIFYRLIGELGVPESAQSQYNNILSFSSGLAGLKFVNYE